MTPKRAKAARRAGERLKAARIAAGYETACAFAKELDIPHEALAAFEAGTELPCLWSISQASLLTNVLIDFLCFGLKPVVENPAPPPPDVKEPNDVCSWLWETDHLGRFVYLWCGPIPSLLDMTRFIGWNRLDIPGFFIDPADLARYAKALMAKRPFRTLTFSAEDKNGQPHKYKVSGRPRFDDNGKFLGYRGSGAYLGPLKLPEQRETA